jgi:hypothetical protein
MMGAPIDQRDLDRQPREVPAGGQASEPTAHDDDAVARGGGLRASSAESLPDTPPDAAERPRRHYASTRSARPFTACVRPLPRQRIGSRDDTTQRDTPRSPAANEGPRDVDASRPIVIDPRPPADG